VKYLLDTCVISEFVKPRPNPGLVSWLRASDEDLMGISVASIAEIQSGIARLPASERRAGLEAWLKRDLIPRFENQVPS
jgi:predicted nucleic acid-binding protein